MRHILITIAMLLMATTGKTQGTGHISTLWPVIANDTSLTYGQITHICDSLFAHSGFSDTLQWKTDTADENGIEEGGGYVKYLRWRFSCLPRVSRKTLRGNQGYEAADVAVSANWYLPYHCTIVATSLFAGHRIFNWLCAGRY